MKRDMEEIRAFDFEDIRVVWGNAISNVGAVTLTMDSPDPVKMWKLADRIGHFLRTADSIKAEAVTFYYVERQESPAVFFIVPRYTNDYPEDNNEVYRIIEQGNFVPKSDAATITPLVDELEAQLNRI